MPKTKPKWREFEELIARIEQTLVGETVKVKSPDFIPSISTGKKREVDASIRMKTGSAEILVTIECRNRSSRQDVTWIEQLSTKREAIGAARTIAVFSTKFSAEAIDTAKRNQIDLRVLSDIGVEDITNWFLPKAIVQISQDTKLAGPPKIFFARSDLSLMTAENLSFSVLSSQYTNDKSETFTFSELVNQVNADAKIYENIPQDDISYTKGFSVSFSEPLYMITSVGNMRVDKLEYELHLRWKHEILPIENTRVARYQAGNPDDPMLPLTRVEVVSRLANNNLRLGIQFESGSDEVSLTVNFL